MADGIRYHINPETGKPGRCTATVRGCKYVTDSGEMPPHYGSKEDARKAYEQQASSEYENIPSLNKVVKEVKTPADYNYLYEPLKIEKMNSEKIGLMLQNLKAGNGGYDSSVEAVIKNPNSTKEHYQTIANNLKGNDFYLIARKTDSQEFIDATLDSSRSHNRNMMFDNPNVPPEKLYAMTKKFSDAKYSKNRIKLLKDKGYDMSHIDQSESQPKKKSVPSSLPKRNKHADMIRRGTLNINKSTIDRAKQFQNNTGKKSITGNDVDNFIEQNGGVDSFINKYATYETTKGTGILSTPQGSYKTIVTDNGDTIRFRNKYGSTASFNFNNKDFEITKDNNGEWSNVKEV